MNEIIDRACNIECVTQDDAKAVAALADLAVKLQSRLEPLEKDAAQMRAALADIASGEVMRIHAFGPFAIEQPEAATADDMMNRAASTLFFIDAAMQANKGE